MNYGLTIYGPLVDNVAAREVAKARLYDVFKATANQAHMTWETLRDYPAFSSAQIHRRPSGALDIEVYYSPPDMPRADCIFHAKISAQGRYE